MKTLNSASVNSTGNKSPNDMDSFYIQPKLLFENTVNCDTSDRGCLCCQLQHLKVVLLSELM